MLLSFIYTILVLSKLLWPYFIFYQMHVATIKTYEYLLSTYATNVIKGQQVKVLSQIFSY